MQFFSSFQDFFSVISVRASDLYYALGLFCVPLRLFPGETRDCNRVLNLAPNFDASENENVLQNRQQARYEATYDKTLNKNCMRLDCI